MTRILVVEDEGIIARDLQRTLQGMGHDVPETCSTGEDAVDAAQRLEPDVVLMDIRLDGDMDGTEAAKLITAHNGAAIVFLTAYADEKTLDRATESVPYGYLVKPYDEGSLRAAVTTALRRREEDHRREERHEQILEQLEQGVLLADSEGRVRYANPAARTMAPGAESVEDWLGPDWTERGDGGPVRVGNESCRVTLRQTDGHWAIVIVPTHAPPETSEWAMAALRERVRELI